MVPCSPLSTAMANASAKTDMIILDGKALAAQMRTEMAAEVQAAVNSGARPPGLAVILAGDDAASQVYVRNKQKACGEVGIASVGHFLPGSVGTADVLALIGELNGREDVDGILLQLPTPSGVNAAMCLTAIDPHKDVDGFHPYNVGCMALGLPAFRPCTPAGVVELLDAYDLSVAGCHAAVIGRSNIVGKPLAMMLSGKDAGATVTLCHSATPDLKAVCLRSDFIFSATGNVGTVTADMVREGAVVVDIGISRTSEGLRGDVDFASVAPKTRAITPVPGGVGPMTIAMLLKNTVAAWRSHLRCTREDA